MTLQRRLDRIILELEDLRDACAWSEEIDQLNAGIRYLQQMALRSDWLK